jgi:alkanesulfonate monooxygenase SsuD/methylene tetrahydromethanopterin reductase-like flavin-dependent oxidoreductase (luciferase family)
MRIDLAGWTRDATQGDPRAFFALFEEADRLGFDGAWFSEFRLPEADWPYPSPLLLAAALLARTDRLRVGTAVLVAPLHQPLLLAEELAQLDFQSGGRIDVGLGRGTEATTLRALQIDAAGTRERFENACAVLQGRPRLPLYVAGSTAETIGFAVQRGIPLLLSLEPPEDRQLAHLDALAGDAAAGLRARSSLARYVCIGADGGKVAEQLDALWPKLYERRVYFAGRRGVPASEVPPIDVERVLREQFIHGDPAACFERIAALRTRTGIPNLRCVFNANGLLGNDVALAGMRLFAREVLPALKAIH